MSLFCCLFTAMSNAETVTLLEIAEVLQASTSSVFKVKRLSGRFAFTEATLYSPSVIRLCGYSFLLNELKTARIE